MPKISDDIIRAVTEAARIEDVVGDFVTLRRAGVNMTGICPFHDDRHDGNFIVRPSTIPAARHGNTYRCFACDAKGGPVQFLMSAQRMTFPDAIRWLGRKYCIPVDDAPLNWTPPPPRPAPVPLPPLELPRAWVKRTMEIESDFVRWFTSLPWSEQQRQRLRRTLWEYCVGGWRDGRVAFWMIDHEGIPRAAKLMKYKPDGHRDKDAHPGWIYNQDGCRQICKPDEHEVRKPLFGSHLLSHYPQATVNVVESEKTALVMANYYGDLDKNLWLACGGLKHLQLDAMQPLIDQGRKVWLWPDKDGMKDWQELADKLGAGNVQVYARYFETCWMTEDGQKADPADINIRMMTTGDKPRQTEAKGNQGAASRGSAAPDPEPAGDTADEEWFRHMEIMKVIGDYKVVNPGDGPFIDHEEHADPRVREWRRKCAVHSSGWGKMKNTKQET